MTEVATRASDVRAQVARELDAELQERDRRGLRRRLRLPAGVDLVSNDYLGLRDHPRLIAAVQDAVATHGVGTGGSRLLRGQQAFFADAEARLAAFSGTEATLLFSSGYAANVGLLQTLLQPGDLVVSDALNHASIVDGVRFSRADKRVVAHGELSALEAALRQGGARRRVLVVTESIFSMDGDLAPLVEMADLCEAYGAALVVDEAHATGLYGCGRVRTLGLQDRVLATVHTGGKALGSGGAWVAGPQALVDTLVNHARTFVFSTAPSSALPAALLAAIDVLADESWRVRELERKWHVLRTALRAHGMAVADDESPIVPIVVGGNEDAVALERELHRAGFDARAIRPPTVPPGTARLRVTVQVPVADEDLLRFAQTVAAITTARPVPVP